MFSAKDILGRAHGVVVFSHRVRVLATLLASQIPDGTHLLDVGTGDGSIAAAIATRRPDLHIEGIDVLIRPRTSIKVKRFDGQHIPYEDESFDAVSLIDVLHHTTNPKALISESARVSRKYILIKDHLREGIFAETTLRLMDWVGNYGHDVALPYNYLSAAQWHTIFDELKLIPERWNERLGLYPFPFSLLFDRRLHFIALMKRQKN